MMHARRHAGDYERLIQHSETLIKFYDPDGTEFGISTYPRKLAPDGLAW